jgi:hypothetical protein
MLQIAQRFKSWQALLAFGLVGCPIPFMGQVFVAAALVWRAKIAWDQHGGRLLSQPASN